MNRRAFLQRFTAGVVGAVALAQVPFSLAFGSEPTRLFTGPLTYRGIPLVYDRDCPRNTIYFINPQTLWVNRGGGWERPFLKDGTV